jgi:hypothetical protein
MGAAVDELEHFRACVLGDLVLQERLRRIPDRELFVARVVSLATERGYGFTADDVLAALRGARRTRRRQVTTPASAADLAGWIPCAVDWAHGRPEVEWCYVGDKRFLEPFFETTIARCARQPFSAFFRLRTSMEAVTAVQSASPGVRPTGFIFHMSRCGSTLVGQMLAALPQCIVLSEPPPIDGMLRGASRDVRVSDAQRVGWLRALIGALGQRRTASETGLFVKFDSWHTLDLPLIERAFPDVPWIFLYRDPIEVIASHLRQPGSQMIPGLVPAAVFGLNGAATLHSGDYCIKVLAEVCRAALSHLQLSKRGAAINYRRLPDAVWSEMATHFGLAFSAEDRDRMRHASAFDAKTPALLFEDDSEAKRRSVPEVYRQLTNEVLLPIHERLEAGSCAPARGCPGTHSISQYTPRSAVTENPTRS